jgi:6-phosphogluconolactonase (cycloisomerase 2 family)
MGASGCGGHYFCSNGGNFGGSSCTPSGSGLGTTGGNGGGGGGGGAASITAFAYDIVQTGSVNGIELTSTPALENISSFNSPTVPADDPSAEIVVAQKQYLYGIFPASESLYGWSIDATTGGLTALSGSPFTSTSLGGLVEDTTGVNFTALALNPTGTLMFIADAGNAEILTYQIGNGGGVTAASTISTVGAVPPWNLAVDGLGKYLYVTSGIEGDGQKVAAYSINPTTGALTLVAAALPFNIWELQGEPTGQYMVGISGNSVGITGVADSSIHVFSIQQSGTGAGTLSEVSGSPFTTLYSPANIAVQPSSANGSYVYSFSVNDTAGYNPIEGYALDTSSGALKAIAGSPFNGVTPSPWGQFDQSGDYLFVYSDIASNPQLAAVNVAAGTGTLTESASTQALSTGGYFAVTDPK